MDFENLFAAANVPEGGKQMLATERVSRRLTDILTHQSTPAQIISNLTYLVHELGQALEETECEAGTLAAEIEDAIHIPSAGKAKWRTTHPRWLGQ